MVDEISKLREAVDCFEIVIESDMIFLEIMGETIASYTIGSTSMAMVLEEVAPILAAARSE